MDEDHRVPGRRTGRHVRSVITSYSIHYTKLYDSSGVITDANTAFLELWGYVRKSEVVGKPISDFVDSEEDALRIVGALEQDVV